MLEKVYEMHINILNSCKEICCITGQIHIGTHDHVFCIKKYIEKSIRYDGMQIFIKMSVKCCWDIMTRNRVTVKLNLHWILSIWEWVYAK